MSLFSIEEAAPVESVESVPEDAASEPSWWIDESTPGVGNRPEFMSEKFKTVADLAKSYKDLEKKLGSAPSEYDFSKGQGWIESDYEPFQQMAEFAKSKHVPQDVMDNFLETVGLYLDEFKVDVEEEKQKLGDKAKERIHVLHNWAKNNLSDKAFGVLTTQMRTAESIEALEEIRGLMLNQGSMVPTGNESTAAPSDNLEKYRSELTENYAKYKTDPAYRKAMEFRLEKIVGRD